MPDIYAPVLHYYYGKGLINMFTLRWKRKYLAWVLPWDSPHISQKHLFWDCFLCLRVQIEQLEIANHLLADSTVFFFLSMSQQLICAPFILIRTHVNGRSSVLQSKTSLFPLWIYARIYETVVVYVCVCVYGRKIIVFNKSLWQYIAQELILSICL